MPEKVTVHPEDQYNQTLVSNVHPSDWVNPEPANRYHLVVIGAGTGGLVTAVASASLGARVALIERHLLGGDCLNVGCVPSKSIIRSSRVVTEIGESYDFGITFEGNVKPDFAAVMERMRRLRSHISHHDSVKRMTDLGIDVFLGDAKFSGSDTIEVEGKILRFKKAVIATGARAYEPPIPGLKEAGFHTNETIFTLITKPDHLLVVGGGPIGCELSQAFRRLGSKVTLVEMSQQFLIREDPDAAQILLDRFREEGIDVRLETSLARVEKVNGKKRAYLKQGDQENPIEVDEILVGAGRAPNVEGLNLEAVGVAYDKRAGVHVDDTLRTTNKKIYAVGDVCLKHKFTHTADATARIVIQNALFRGKKRVSALVIPWCTYTDPEIAHVGMYEKDARKKGIPVDTFVIPMEDVDRALLDGEEKGLAKVHVKKGTDKILGATIVARHAGEMISELTLAIAGNVGLKTISSVIHPYPTQAEAIRKAADAYNRTRLTPFTKKVLSFMIRYLS
jgi:mercury(II) reductase